MIKSQDHGALLIVDDEAIIRESLQHWLEMEGFRVFVAENGEQALQICKFEKLDVGVFDIRMPGMDGITLLAHTRSCCPDLDVIMMTAFASIEDAVKCISEGAHDYIIKPFPPEKLTQSIHHIIESRRLHASQRSMVEQQAVLSRFFRECESLLSLGTTTAVLSSASWPSLHGQKEAMGIEEKQALSALVDRALLLSEPAFQRENNDFRLLVETALVLVRLRHDPQNGPTMQSTVSVPLSVALPYVPMVLALSQLIDHFQQKSNLSPLLLLRAAGSKSRRVALQLQTIAPIEEAERRALIHADAPPATENARLLWASSLLRLLGVAIQVNAADEGHAEIVLTAPALGTT